MDERALGAEAARLIDEGLCRGVQVAWMSHESTVELALGADGLGRPLDSNTLLAVYCAGKPLLAMCVAELCRTGALTGLDQRLPEVEPSLDVPNVSLRSLLDHTSGLHVHDGDHIKLRSSAGKLHAAVSARAPAGWDPASGAGYSEFIAWRLLALAVEVATNAPWPDVVDALVLDRLGVSRDVHVALDRERASDRLGVNIDLRTRPRPMLSEMSSSFTSPNAAYGTFATATGLCRVLHCLATDPAAPGQTLLGEQRRGHRWDEVMQATVDTQPGLLVSLPDYGVVGTPRDSFGHTGLMGLTTVAHDPSEQVTMCITFVGLIDGPTSVSVRRPRLLRHMFTA